MVEETKKRYFEDIEVGDCFVTMGRTITESDIVSFAGLSGDYNTIHTDAEFAKTSIAGQRLAHGLLPLVVSSGLYTRTAYNLSILETMTALLEIRSWKMKRPVVIGDTIHVEIKIAEKTDSKPESPNGMVVFNRTIYNQRNELVQTGEFVSLIKKRAAQAK